MSRLVTVATFTYPHEVVMVRARLQAEGIACFTKDELTVQVHNFLSNAIGGIKLQVREEDAGRARRVLQSTGVRPEEGPRPERSRLASEHKPASCTHCGSDNVRRERGSRLVAMIILLLFFIPIPFPSRKWHCFGCGRKFER